MSKELEALFFIDGRENRPRVKFPADCSLEELIQAVEGKFKDFLDKNQLCITLFQLYNKDYDEYVDIEESELKDIPNKSRIKAVTDTRESVSQDYELKAVDNQQPSLVPLVFKKPPENGCETCFSFKDDQESSPATPQDESGEQAGGICPHNRLWGKSKLRVYFLNPIPSSWTYNGHKYPVPNAQPGHVIDKSDILKLANEWNIHHPSVPKKQCEYVPSFVEAKNPQESDIRVWFQTNGKCVTKIGTAAENIPKGDKEANATMRLDLSGESEYMEHLVMHEFGHALGLGHEHQQKMFGSFITKFFNEKDVKRRFNNMSDEQYARDVAAYSDDDDHKTHSDYDPDSIMHYWFCLESLKLEYNTEDKVKLCSGISDQEREFLLTFHRRKGIYLAEEISKTDYKFVAKAYYNHRTKREDNGASNASAGGAPNPKPQLLSLSSEPGQLSPYFFDNSGSINRKPQSSSPRPPTRHIKLHRYDSKYFNVLYEASFTAARKKWREIGNALKIPNNDLNSINTTYSENPGRCYNAMLAKWFESCTNCYFDVFTDALKAPTVDLAPAIEEIEKKVYEYVDIQVAKNKRSKMNINN